ncbi:hypothetical protein PoB_000206900 [Plakobranchus ocellatus]|uniref:Uncharacterized protein n=1 Tax=Plakobranchus ocellatus TaxID=259542 RepID=A0AAV3Y0Q6_9GAST|nr:hypothetical protein PoB_000206900 [Plakobranchus ocellatus]
MAPRSATGVIYSIQRSKRSKSDLCHRGRKQGIRDMMAKVTGSGVIEMTYFDAVHSAPSRKQENFQSSHTSRSDPLDPGNLDDQQQQQQQQQQRQKRFPLLGPTRQETELFFSISKRPRG